MPEMAEIRAWLGELPGGSWLLAATGFVAFVRVAVKALAISVRDLRDLWNSVATPEKRRRAAVRRATAAYIRGRLGDLKDAQTWVDRQYTELEAEIEAEGRRFWGWLFYRRARIRRERSLSAALHGSSETRILLIGDPGAGKSVALRRIAYRSADAAARALPAAADFLLRQPAHAALERPRRRRVAHPRSRAGGGQPEDEQRPAPLSRRAVRRRSAAGRMALPLRLVR